MRSRFIVFVVALGLAFSLSATAKSKKKKHKEYTPRMNGVEYLINQDHAEHPVTKTAEPKEEKVEKTEKVEKVEKAEKVEKKKPAPKSEEPALETPEQSESPKPQEQPPAQEKTSTSKSNIHDEVKRLAEEARSGRSTPAGTRPVTTSKSVPAKKPAKAVEEAAPAAETPETSEAAAPKAPVIPTIIIDPGHGGKDPGASGLKGRVREKDVILAIGRQLAIALRKKLGAKVTMTRSNDTFITLGERNRIANRKHADMFLSIHGNASPNKQAQGIEIYYLNKATDQAAKRLAARENEGAPKAEADMEAIVSDLLQTAATEESSDLAKRVRSSFLRNLQKKYKIEDVNVKTALFYVLVGAKCPSLLIETGFVTNPVEGKRLTKPVFQRDMANAIADAVATYWKHTSDAGGDL